MKRIIIFDFNRTLYDPEAQELFPGSLLLLRKIQESGIEMHLVARRETGRRDTLKKLGIEKYFTSITFVKKKTPLLFENILVEAGASSKDSYVIGDRIREEIICGNRCGMQTIWFQNGKFKNEEPASLLETPVHQVRRLKDILRHIC